MDQLRTAIGRTAESAGLTSRIGVLTAHTAFCRRPLLNGR